MLVVLSGLLTGFYEQVNMNLGELLDLLALINNSVKLILYCLMSAQFRNTFMTVFCAPDTFLAKHCCCNREKVR